MIKLRVPHLDWQKLIGRAVWLLMLAVLAHAVYLISQVHLIEPDQAHLAEEQAKLDQEQLRFDLKTLNEISSPPPLKDAGRNPFAP